MIHQILLGIVGVVVILGTFVYLGEAQAKAIARVQKRYQAFTVSTSFPNVVIDLTDGTGVAPFSVIDNVQVTTEWQSQQNPAVVPWASIDFLSTSTLQINVVELSSGVPATCPSGVKVWVLVEGLGP